MEVLRTRLWRVDGRRKSPSAAIVDGQTIPTVGGGGRGYDAVERKPGRKRHIDVDTPGLLAAVLVHPASVQGRDGVKSVLARLEGWFPQLRPIWPDAAFAAEVGGANAFAGWLVESVRTPTDQRGFVVLPRCWAVGRTLAWLMRGRRLARDHERLLESSEAMLKVSMTHLILKRLRPA